MLIAEIMISRNITSVINYVLDNLCPPILRECRLIMRPITSSAFGKSTEDVLDFKEKEPFMQNSEIVSYYGKIKNAPINRRVTDLNAGYIIERVTLPNGFKRKNSKR